MAKYRIAITNIEYGCIDVKADSVAEAMDKAELLDGDYFVRNSEVTESSFLEMVDK